MTQVCDVKAVCFHEVGHGGDIVGRWQECPPRPHPFVQSLPTARESPVGLSQQCGELALGHLVEVESKKQNTTMGKIRLPFVYSRQLAKR